VLLGLVWTTQKDSRIFSRVDNLLPFVDSALVSQLYSKRHRAIRIDHVPMNPNHNVATYDESESLTCRHIRITTWQLTRSA